jgi:hypothetical protein
MNDKINIIAVQSDCADYHNDVFKLNEITESNFELFAELIIKSCIKIHTAIDNGNSVMNTKDYPAAV